MSSFMRLRQRREVLLPHPDGPMNAVISLPRTSRLTSRSAWKLPYQKPTSSTAKTVAGDTSSAVAGTATSGRMSGRPTACAVSGCPVGNATTSGGGPAGAGHFDDGVTGGRGATVKGLDERISLSVHLGATCPQGGRQGPCLPWPPDGTGPDQDRVVTDVPLRRLPAGHEAVSLRARRFPLADRAFSALTLGCGLVVLAVLVLIAFSTTREAMAVFRSEGIGFVTGRVWDPPAGRFGALPFIYGTLVVSTIALVFAVPVSVGIALFLTEVSPRSLRKPASYVIDV